MKILLTCLLLMMSFQSFADKKYFVELIEEENQFIVAEFSVEKNKLQEKIQESKFQTKQLAQIYYEKKLSEYSHHKTQFSFVSTEVQSQVLWHVENEWSLEYEKLYQTWITENLYDKFFYDRGIHTDCADAAYMSRWIFARLHKLPMANTLAGSMVLFTHESMKTEWLRLSPHENWEKDQRFIAALNYLANNTYTKTIYWDLYPVALNQESFGPGTVYFLGGHTLLIYKMDYSGNGFPVTTINSTVPRELRILTIYPFTPSVPVDSDVGGLMQFVWPVKINNRWVLMKKEKMPMYSKEQYEIKDNFALALFKKLNIQFDLNVFFKNLTHSVIDMVDERIQIVQAGYDFCQKNSCIEGSSHYDNHSTPNRDARLLDQYHAITNTIYTLNSLDEEINEKWDHFTRTKFNINGQPLSYKTLFDFLDYNIISSDPNDSIAYRWGLNEQGALQTLLKKFKIKLNERNKIVEAGQICYPNKCPIGSANYKKYSTADLDIHLTNYISNLIKYCKTNQSCKSLLETSEALYLRSAVLHVSDPNYNLQFKLGNKLPKNFKLLPIHEELLLLNHKKVLLDKKIFNLETFRFETNEINILSRLKMDNELMFLKKQNDSYFILNANLEEAEIEIPTFENQHFHLLKHGEYSYSVYTFNQKDPLNCQIVFFNYVNNQVIPSETRNCQSNKLKVLFSNDRTVYLDQWTHHLIHYPQNKIFEYNIENYEKFYFDYKYLNPENSILTISYWDNELNRTISIYYLLKTGDHQLIKIDLPGYNIFDTKNHYVFRNVFNESLNKDEYHIYEILNSQVSLVKIIHDQIAAGENIFTLPDQGLLFKFSAPLTPFLSYKGQFVSNSGNYFITQEPDQNITTIYNLVDGSHREINIKGTVGHSYSNQLRYISYIKTYEDAHSIHLFDIENNKELFPIQSYSYNDIGVTQDYEILTIGNYSKVYIEN